MTAGSEKKLAILFADVVGSTHLYEILGDDRARETVQQKVLDELRTKHITELARELRLKTPVSVFWQQLPSLDKR